MDVRAQHGRGRYDRSLPSTERSRRQRERLLASCADRLERGEDLTVATVTHGAGVGRNTLYEHFGDVDDLLEAMIHDAAVSLRTRLGAALASESTPLAACEACARAWLNWLEEPPHPRRWLSAIVPQRAQPVWDELRVVAERCVERGRAGGSFARDANPEAVLCVVGALKELGLGARSPELDIGDSGKLWSRLVGQAFREPRPARGPR